MQGAKQFFDPILQCLGPMDCEVFPARNRIPLYFTLEASQHTVEIVEREDGTMLDAIVISKIDGASFFLVSLLHGCAGLRCSAPEDRLQSVWHWQGLFHGKASFDNNL